MNHLFEIVFHFISNKDLVALTAGITSFDANTGGTLLVQRRIICHSFLIFLRVYVEDQVGVTHRIIVNQVV